MTTPLCLNPQQTAPGVILPHVLNVAPAGTKMRVLDLGSLVADVSFVLRGANSSTASNPKGPENPERRALSVNAVLIDHPEEGLILFDTGCGRDVEKRWGPIADVFAPEMDVEGNDLAAQIKLAGYDYRDVKKIIISHAHLDHAGGLPLFFDSPSKPEIWCHKQELESAFFSVATGADDIVYRKDYLSLDLDWKVFDDRTIDFARGITLHHFPGHSAGLVGMQVNLPDSGSFIFTSDQAHIWENYEPGLPQGHLARDHPAWFQSNQRLRRLAKTTGARVLPGHDLAKMQDLFGKTIT